MALAARRLAGRRRVRGCAARAAAAAVPSALSGGPAAAAEAKAALREALRGTARGCDADGAARGAVEEAQVALERLGAPVLDPLLLAGTWRLVWTTASDVLVVLQAARTGAIQVGDIYQNFTADGRVENVIRFSLPLVLQPVVGAAGDGGGRLRVDARWERVGDRTIGLTFLEARVGDLRASELLEFLLAPALLPGRGMLNLDLLLWLRELELAVPLRGSAATALGDAAPAGAGAPVGSYLLTYCDEDCLVGRQQVGGGTFIFERAGPPPS